MLYQTQHCYIHSKREARFRKSGTNNSPVASNSQFREVFRIDAMLHLLQYIPFHQILDSVGPEPCPVVVSGDDDRRLQIPQAHYVLAGSSVFGDVDDGVFDSGLVESAVGGIALNARGLGVHGHWHVIPLMK